MVSDVILVHHSLDAPTLRNIRSSDEHYQTMQKFLVNANVCSIILLHNLQTNHDL